MKIKPALITFIPFVLSFAILSLSSSVSAKEVRLYEQPDTGAKVIGSIDLSKGVIPIFTPKDGQWMKIGDPRNGNVGWIKSNELNNEGGFTFTQKIINNSDGPHTYQIIEYGKPKNLSSEQIQGMVQKMQMQQQAIQQSVQKAAQDLINDMKNLYQWNTMNGMDSFPLIMPIVIVPSEQKNKLTNQPAKATQTTSPSSTPKTTTH